MLYLLHGVTIESYPMLTFPPERNRARKRLFGIIRFLMRGAHEIWSITDDGYGGYLSSRKSVDEAHRNQRIADRPLSQPPKQ